MKRVGLMNCKGNIGKTQFENHVKGLENLFQENCSQQLERKLILVNDESSFISNMNYVPLLEHRDNNFSTDRIKVYPEMKLIGQNEWNSSCQKIFYIGNLNEENEQSPFFVIQYCDYQAPNKLVFLYSGLSEKIENKISPKPYTPSKIA